VKAAAGLVRTWDGFWFAPESPVNLAAARVIFAAHALWILLSRDLAALSGLPPEFFAGVASSARWRFLLWPGHPGLESILQAATVLALVLAILGVWPRACCLAGGLLLYHLAPLETLMWTPSPYERGFTIAVPALVALGVARHDDGWALRLAQLFLCQVYLFAGYAKLYRVGWSWVSSENMARWLLVFNQQDQIAVFHSLGPWLAERPALCLAVAALALLLDFGFVLVLFSRPSRAFLVPAALLAHLGILLGMNIAFLNVPQLLVFVDWEALRRRWRERPGQRSPSISAPILSRPRSSSTARSSRGPDKSPRLQAAL
jgi:hypothetical protein